MNKYFVCLIFLICINSHGQTIELFCKGSNSGSDIRTVKHEFPILVSFSKAEFGGIRNFLVPSCMSDTKNPNNAPTCKSNSNEIDCVCSNSRGTTAINLSRVTGRLDIQTFFVSKESWYGDYYCEKITTKKF